MIVPPITEQKTTVESISEQTSRIDALIAKPRSTSPWPKSDVRR